MDNTSCQLPIAMAEPKSNTEDDLKWSYVISGKRLTEALREWQVLRHPNDQYQMLNVSDEDIKIILTALGVAMRPAVYSKGEILALKANVKIF